MDKGKVRDYQVRVKTLSQRGIDWKDIPALDFRGTESQLRDLCRCLAQPMDVWEVRHNRTRFSQGTYISGEAMRAFYKKPRTKRKYECCFFDGRRWSTDCAMDTFEAALSYIVQIASPLAEITKARVIDSETREIVATLELKR